MVDDSLGYVVVEQTSSGNEVVVDDWASSLADALVRAAALRDTNMYGAVGVAELRLVEHFRV